MEKIPGNVKIIIGSVLPFTVVIILFLIIGPFAVSKIVDVRSQIDEAEKNQQILSQKITLLESISSSITTDVGVAFNALPSTNPSLVALSQIKAISQNNGVSISGAKSGAPIQDASGVSHIDISFQVSGARPQIISFLQNIASIAPITIVDKLKITETGGTSVAGVTVKSYWADLPKTLPVSTTPINDLTDDEKKILISVSGLVQPAFTDLPAISEPQKSDPFSR